MPYSFRIVCGLFNVPRNRPIRLTQCCTQFKSHGVKVLWVFYLHDNVPFTLKWHGNTWNKTFYSPRIWIGYNIELAESVYCEHSRVVRRDLRFMVLTREDLKVLTICRCNYKGSTFCSVILRPWVLVRPESNSRPPAGQTLCSTNWATGPRARILWTHTDQGRNGAIELNTHKLSTGLEKLCSLKCLCYKNKWFVVCVRFTWKVAKLSRS